MKETLISWLIPNQTPAPLVIVILFLILLIVSLWKINDIKSLFPKAKKIHRSCSDCMMIAYGIWLKCEAAVSKIKNGILDEQKKFAEGKLEEFELVLLQSYKNDQLKLRENCDDICRLNEEHKQYVLYQEALHNAFRLVYKEIVRSCRENGFCQLHTDRFATYVKNKTKDLIRIARQYLMTIYPRDGMFVTLQHRFQNLDERAVEDVVFEIYIYAKTVDIEAHKNIKLLEDQFHVDVDKHIGVKENK